MNLHENTTTKLRAKAAEYAHARKAGALPESLSARAGADWAFNAVVNMDDPERKDSIEAFIAGASYATNLIFKFLEESIGSLSLKPSDKDVLLIRSNKTQRITEVCISDINSHLSRDTLRAVLELQDHCRKVGNNSDDIRGISASPSAVEPLLQKPS